MRDPTIETLFQTTIDTLKAAHDDYWPLPLLVAHGAIGTLLEGLVRAQGTKAQQQHMRTILLLWQQCRTIHQAHPEGYCRICQQLPCKVMSGQACCHDLVQQGRCYHQELAALQREESTPATHHQVPETQRFTDISAKKREKVMGARRDHRERIAAC